MKKILLIGGSGFIGKSIYAKLNKQNDIYIYDRNNNFGIEQNKWYQGEFLDSKFLTSMVEGKDVVINLIRPSSEKLLTDAEMKSHVSLANACAQGRVKLIFVSSVAVYGDQDAGSAKETSLESPISMYGLNKLITEKIYLIERKKRNYDLCILRLSNPLGVEQIYSQKKNILTAIIKSINENAIFCIPKNIEVQRDFIYINDFIRIVDNFINNYDLPEIINVGAGLSHSLIDFVKIVESLLEIKIETEEFELPKDQIINSSIDTSLLNKLYPKNNQIDLKNALKEIFTELGIFGS